VHRQGVRILIPIRCLTLSLPHLTRLRAYAEQINESVPDEEIEKLVKACGDVKTVRRMHDPLSHKARRFAFCEFHDAEGVLVAMRLLQNLEVHGERLAISINSSTKSFIQYHKANERSEPEGCEADQQADAKARELIDTVLGPLRFCNAAEGC
jgi:RNA-binding protein 25